MYVENIFGKNINMCDFFIHLPEQQAIKFSMQQHFVPSHKKHSNFIFHLAIFCSHDDVNRRYSLMQNLRLVNIYMTCIKTI